MDSFQFRMALFNSDILSFKKRSLTGWTIQAVALHGCPIRRCFRSLEKQIDIRSQAVAGQEVNGVQRFAFTIA